MATNAAFNNLNVTLQIGPSGKCYFTNRTVRTRIV